MGVQIGVQKGVQMGVQMGVQIGVQTGVQIGVQTGSRRGSRRGPYGIQKGGPEGRVHVLYRPCSGYLSTSSFDVLFEMGQSQMMQTGFCFMSLLWK